jgi:ELWxxDGT repeat protein
MTTPGNEPAMNDLRRRPRPGALRSPLIRASAWALGCLLPLAAAAQTATLVSDLDLDEGGESSFELGRIVDIAAVPGRVFFSAQIGSFGSGEEVEMWASDGTAEGTFLLVDACPGSCSSAPQILGSLRGVLLWAGRSNDGQAYLWRSDGTRAGTYRLTDEPIRLNTRESSFDTAQISSVAGGFLYFAAAGAGGSGDALWRTDGTRAGTQVVRALGAEQLVETLLTDAGKVFLVVRSDTGSSSDTTWSIWSSDGTAAGTRELADLDKGRPRKPRVAGGRLFVVARNGAAGDELWASDGTVAGTRTVTDFVPFAPFVDPSQRDDYRPLVSGGRFYFVADDVTHGQELYESDGTVAGTRRITDFGIDEPGFGQVANLGSRVVFVAGDGLGHYGVWVTGRDPAGTRFQPLPCGADCHEDIRAFVKVGPRVVLLVQANSGRKILSTDGTPAGTRLVRGCANGCDVALPQNVAAEMAALPFATGAIDALWTTDGTPAGTRRRATLRQGYLEPSSYSEISAGSFTMVFAEGRLWTLGGPGGGGFRLVTAPVHNGPGTHPANLVPLGDSLAFTGCDGGLFSLWKSAGTAATTAPAVVLAAPPPDSGDCVTTVEQGKVASLGSALVFLQKRFLSSTEELWRTDGTPGGTEQLTSADLPIQGLLAVGSSRVYFLASKDETVSLWTSNGTRAGTVELAAWPTSEGSPSFLTALGDQLYFHLGGFDKELWTSDGTPGGTRKLVENGGSASVTPWFTRVGSTVYFVAPGADSTEEIWRTDGTPGGTRTLGPIAGLDRDSNPREPAAFQGSLYFFAETAGGAHLLGLWRSDGTAAGTVLLAGLGERSQRIYPAGHRPTAAAGRLFFVVDGGADRGVELWATDGTAAGTRPVRDISPGAGSPFPDDLTAAGGQLYFTAAEETYGRELWVSDGTEAGTRLVQDIAPFGQSSGPDDLTAAGGRLYFTADDGVSGRELWSLPLAGPAGCQPSATRLCLNGGRYQVEASWRIDDLFGEGRSGHGTAVPLSGDTGYFWFFDQANVEAVVKVLDGRGLNNHVWVFYGALSDVDYTLTVTDTQTGVTRRYHNPPGRLASVGDTQGFGPLGAFATAVETIETPAAAPLDLVSERVDPAAAVPCQPGPGRLCLNGNRFAVEVAWKDFQNRTGPGTAVPLTADTGTFWFFDAANVELVVKVLDGRGLNGKFWLFYGALSNVEYTLTVTDTETGTIRTYRNPSGRFASVADTGAF